MRFTAQRKCLGIVAVFTGLLASCSILIDGELDGLVPYPSEAGKRVASDASDVLPDEQERKDSTAGLDRPIPNADAKQTDHLHSGAPDAPVDAADGLARDGATEDRNPVSNDRSGDPDSRVDGSLDASPPGDGRVLGTGNWTLSGGPAPRSSYEVRHWKMSTAAVRGTTTSGLSVEGWLQ